MTLDGFVDELLRRARAKAYVPVIFMRMRSEYGTAPAIKRLVETSEQQSGFERLRQLGLLTWSRRRQF